MKPLVHHVYTVKHNRPSKKIKTVVGKGKFKTWAKKHYFENQGERICFQVDGWDTDRFYKAIPFFYLAGNNKGKSRVVFTEIIPDSNNEYLF